MTLRWTECRLDSRSYWDAESFERERQAIFGRSWLYAGLAGEFSEMPRPVRTAGLEAAVACRAGVWQAEAGGQAIAVSCCGGLVFWSLDPAMPLEAYLAPFHDTLAALSVGLHVPDHRLSRPIAANWKLLAENTLDDYHIMTAHARTLYPSMLQAGVRRTLLDRQGRHSLWRNDLNAADAVFWTRAARRLGIASGGEDGQYRHLFLFPNFYLANFADVAFILHRLDPLTAESTVLEVDFCIPAAEMAGNAARAALKRAVLADFVAKADAVLAEDVMVCEAAQQGQRFAVHPGILGLREQRVGDFQEAVVEALQA